MKAQITMDDELMRKVDEYADQNYMSRSGLIALACSQFLMTSQVQNAIIDMSVTMRKIADEGLVDEANQRKLADFARIAQMFGSTVK